MLNLKITKKAPLLTKGQYTTTITRYREIESNKAIITIAINDNNYNVWLDATKEITLNDGTVTTPAQLILDAICSQVSEEILDTVETVDELITVLIQEQAQLNVWVSMFEERLNNFSFFKPKNFDVESALGI